MILWNGEVYINWKNKPHEPEWVSWHDYQAACTWYACKKCQEKFFVSDEEAQRVDSHKGKMDKSATNQHNDLVEKLCRASTQGT